MTRIALLVQGFWFLLIAIGIGADSSAPMPSPKSPFSEEAFELAAAVNRGDSKKLSSIIANGVNPFIVMGDGTTMLHGACAFSKPGCAIVLIDVASPSELNR